VFAASGPGEFNFRVETVLDGAAQDVTADCTFTPASPLVSVGSGAAFSISSAARRTIAAIVVECLGKREIVGFLLRSSSEQGQQ
jgi:hypothetical protein